MSVEEMSRIKSQARAWLVRVEDEAATDADRAACAAWRDADPRNDAAFRRMETIWTDAAELADFDPLIGGDALAETPVRSPKRFAPWTALAAAACVAVVALGLAVSMERPPTSHVYSTEVAEIRDVALSDGTVVTLGARSSIETSFSDGERRVELLAGEAFFDVAHDEDHPFVVRAGDTNVRVLGTKFDMRRSVDGVRVSVLEGVVRVDQRPARDPAGGAVAALPALQRTVITAGQTVSAIDGGALSDPAQAGVAAAGVWREGRLVYVDAPLVDVIADANRYSPRRIVLEAGLDDLLISASYRADAIDELVASLAENLPITVDDSRADRVVLRARAE